MAGTNRAPASRRRVSQSPGSGSCGEERGPERRPAVGGDEAEVVRTHVVATRGVGIGRGTDAGLLQDVARRDGAEVQLHDDAPQRPDRAPRAGRIDEPRASTDRPPRPRLRPARACRRRPRRQPGPACARDDRIRALDDASLRAPARAPRARGSRTPGPPGTRCRSGPRRGPPRGRARAAAAPRDRRTTARARGWPRPRARRPAGARPRPSPAPGCRWARSPSRNATLGRPGRELPRPARRGATGTSRATPGRATRAPGPRVPDHAGVAPRRTGGQRRPLVEHDRDPAPASSAARAVPTIPPPMIATSGAVTCAIPLLSRATRDDRPQLPEQPVDLGGRVVVGQPDPDARPRARGRAAPSGRWRRSCPTRSRCRARPAPSRRPRRCGRRR